MCQSSKSMLYLCVMISSVRDCSFIRTKLPETEWRSLWQAHQKKVATLIDDYLERRQHQQKDPVMDFLFEYYAFRPSHLKRWSPGFGVLLERGTKDPLPDINEMLKVEAGAFLDPEQFPESRKNSLKWILTLLEGSRERKPAFGCFGMHEWAMVYKRDHLRHQRELPLRMEKEALAEFVESRPLVCTHFDAFRFFSDPAKPMNKQSLSRENFTENEQPGCLHTNMDLYKWAFKGFPWISSDLIREAFTLAVEARFIDMKASPYDLSSRGLEPIKIESEEGRKEYLEKQKHIFRKSIPIREQLIEEYRCLSGHFEF